MNPLVIAVILSVASAFGYAIASVAQERLAAAKPRKRLTSAKPPERLTSAKSAPRGGLAPLRSIRWWLAITPNGVGAALHTLALRYGALAIVQLLGTLTLVFALPISARIAGRRPTRREWCGAGATVLGLAGLIPLAEPDAPSRTLGNQQLAWLILVIMGITLSLIVLAGPDPRIRSLGLATASGIAFGTASVLTQTLLLRLAHNSLGDWDLGAMCSGAASATAITLLSLAGLLLSQRSYQGGLGAQLAVISTSNPVAAAIIGYVLLGQRLAPTPTGLLLAATATTLTVYGVFLLSGGATPEVADPTPITSGTVGPDDIRRNRRMNHRNRIHSIRSLRHSSIRHIRCRLHPEREILDASDWEPPVEEKGRAA